MVASAALVLTTSPAQAATVRQSDARGDAPARYDITKMVIINGTPKVSYDPEKLATWRAGQLCVDVWIPRFDIASRKTQKLIVNIHPLGTRWHGYVSTTSRAVYGGGPGYSTTVHGAVSWSHPTASYPKKPIVWGWGEALPAYGHSGVEVCVPRSSMPSAVRGRAVTVDTAFGLATRGDPYDWTSKVRVPYR